MLALGRAAREAVLETTGLAPDLRWPNDLMIEDRKCGGMLAQVDGGAIIAGIGINVGQPQFPADLETPATSLALEGMSLEREDLLIALLYAVERHSRVLADKRPAAVLRTFTEVSSYAAGRRCAPNATGAGSKAQPAVWTLPASSKSAKITEEKP